MALFEETDEARKPGVELWHNELGFAEDKIDALRNAGPMLGLSS